MFTSFKLVNFPILRCFTTSYVLSLEKGSLLCPKLSTSCFLHHSIVEIDFLLFVYFVMIEYLEHYRLALHFLNYLWDWLVWLRQPDGDLRVKGGACTPCLIYLLRLCLLFRETLCKSEDRCVYFWPISGQANGQAFNYMRWLGFTG